MRILALIALVAALSSGAALAGQGSSAATRRPNIVFILTDDLSWNLVKYMPHVRRMQAEGTTFSKFFVSNSLCCPSRATIFTGKYPHNTGIFTNGGREGGFTRFHQSGLERETFATRLHAAGYTTALLGKYLNEYTPTGFVDGANLYVPPGWDDWYVPGKAYGEYDYFMNENRRLRYYGRKPSDYLTDVLAARSQEFVERMAGSKKPFLLEIATFAPHSPFTPAPRHENLFPRVKAPRTPAFNEANLSDKPSWLRNRRSLRTLQVASIDEAFRKRVQAVQSIDELLGRVEEALQASGQLSNTYIFFSSDNGLHLGDHRLAAGKQTAFEPDIRVPLIVTGPRVLHGRTVDNLASTIDLYPTFVQLGAAGVPPTIDGRSLLPLLRGQAVGGWRNAVLIEHHGPDVTRNDPDFPGPFGGNPKSYQALRTPNALYVEYVGGELEYYNLKKDPYELNNSPGLLTATSRQNLHNELVAVAHCAGQASCWTAAGGR
jgi:N-acetylglucosamine-6-sulfatase